MTVNLAKVSNPEPEMSTLPSPSPPRESALQRTWKYVLEECDPDMSTVPLSCYCLMTGYIDSITFSACYIWCAFQTGNTIQLSLAISRLFTGPYPRELGFQEPDQQALCSLLTFLFGAFLGRIGDWWGAKRRSWLIMASLIQAGFTLAACLCALYGAQSSFAGPRGSPTWTNPLGFAALGFASASMGLQAHVGTRLGSQFATSVVLTTIWVQLVGDPKLFSPHAPIKSRDHKALAIFMLFLGGLMGRALTGTIGAANTFAVGAAMRLLIAVSWWWVPKKAPKPQPIASSS
ncbi:hypothetical protein DACRYDRAFT_22920 [Dacryopinax primogenitus]|uniref:DUF1275 domain protein n=1 Tax=Dacryopinax primogenitus (strain DJM 731) TaxID=1858805 RepID=M5FU02_DACPD|nr:uncharacterized protein DACRYDRAFT_22920 [Dacryopinax primogenitus]EJU01156.1 hypothetical protein DACRYDRAFT_22920 [Dacryopinax primogenitus]